MSTATPPAPQPDPDPRDPDSDFRTADPGTVERVLRRLGVNRTR